MMAAWSLQKTVDAKARTMSASAVSNSKPRARKKLLLVSACILLWAAVVACALELWAVAMLRRGHGILAKHQVDREIRKVAEAFHKDLWAHPWKLYKPHAAVRIDVDGKTYSTTINSFHLRGPEFIRKRGALVIACLGGSTTVNGPTNSETYPAFLEGMLNENSSRPIVVVNAGVSARLSEDYIHQVRILMTNAKPDIVVEYNGANDLCVMLVKKWKDELGPVKRLLARSRFVTYMFEDFLLPDEQQIRDDIRNYTIKHLKQIESLLTSQGVKFAVCSFLQPDVTGAPECWKAFLDHDLRLSWRTGYVTFKSYSRMVDLYNEELRKAFVGSDVRYLPLAESLPLRSDAFIDICHLKPEVIEKKARAIAALLEADGELLGKEKSATDDTGSAEGVSRDGDRRRE